MKKFQHVHITILGLLLAGSLGMTVLALNSFRDMILAKNEDSIAPKSVIVLKQNKQPYSTIQYQSIINLFNKTYFSSNVTAEIKNNKIVLTSTEIENELDVRQAMLSLLALDKNLVVDSICGKVDKSCNGFPLEVIIRGEKNNTSIAEQPLI